MYSWCALLQLLRVPVERVGVYLLRFERGLQSPQDARESIAWSETENMMDNWLLVQLVDRVRGKRGIEPEDYRIPDLSIVLDELACNITWGDRTQAGHRDSQSLNCFS